MMLRYARTILCILVAGGLIGLAGTGCDILEVSNPNNLQEEKIDPTSAVSLANGAEAAVTRALASMYGPYHAATGELSWIGSRNAWGELDAGTVHNPSNEFSDGAFPYFGEATWVTRTYIDRLEGFRKNDDLQDVRPLVRTYLYGAIIYTSTADIFDNFVLSDRMEAGKPIGEENMDQMYDQAITWLDSAIDIVNQTSSLQGTRLEAALYAMRARAKYSKGLWGKLNPSVNTSEPLVHSSGAVADAKAALSRMGEGSDFRYEMELISSSPGLVDGAVSMAFQITNRRELLFADRYISRDSEGAFKSVTYEDVISGNVHPYLKSYINNFVAERQYADVPVVSQRGMYLILAEAALAQNNTSEFTKQINRLRALDNLPEYNGQVPAMRLLKQSREVNLFLQGRRLADHYRFQTPSSQWDDSRSEPGTFFPITITEIRANPNLSQ